MDDTTNTSSSYAPRSPDLSALSTLPTTVSSHSAHHNLHHPDVGSRDSFSLSPLNKYSRGSSALPSASHRPPNQPPDQELHVSSALPGLQYPPQSYDSELWYRQQAHSTQFIDHTRQNSTLGGNMPKVEESTRKLAPGESEGIEVRTKFPVARIKRIMQADEDVGKVAQVTPVIVSRALELFMISLALKSASEARARNSKRITAYHLKEAVGKDEHFDFLSEIVGKIPDASGVKEKEAKTSKRKEDSPDDDDAVDFEESKPPKKQRGLGVRKVPMG